MKAPLSDLYTKAELSQLADPVAASLSKAQTLWEGAGGKRTPPTLACLFPGVYLSHMVGGWVRGKEEETQTFCILQGRGIWSRWHLICLPLDTQWLDTSV